MTPPSPRLVRACAALEPYAWRQLTSQMVARRVLGAADGLRDPGEPGRATRHDRRVEPLVHVLQTELRQWRTLTVDTLCRRLLHALDAWEAQDDWLDVELAWLLGDGAG